MPEKRGESEEKKEREEGREREEEGEEGRREGKRRWKGRKERDYLLHLAEKFHQLQSHSRVAFGIALRIGNRCKLATAGFEKMSQSSNKPTNQTREKVKKMAVTTVGQLGVCTVERNMYTCTCTLILQMH